MHKFIDIESYLNGGVVQSLVTTPPDLDAESVKSIAKSMTNSLEICITFRDELIDRFEDETLMAMITEKLSRRFKKMPPTAAILLIGEHSDIGRYHLHGLIQGIPNDDKSRLLKQIKREFGRSQIKMLTYSESYIDYIFKSYIPREGHISGDRMAQERWHPSRFIYIIGSRKSDA